ncbi:hypothetical protein ACXC9Q_15555 [Kribbella sp. CWNU-51]
MTDALDLPELRAAWDARKQSSTDLSKPHCTVDAAGWTRRDASGS